jgi:hypothetical protein
MSALTGILILLIVWLFIAVPGYVIAERRGLDRPWVAFIPLLGLHIILLESIGRSGMYVLLILIPYLGAFGLGIWLAIEMPLQHDRPRWWTLPLLVPGLNLIAYWAYAFTLPGHDTTPSLQQTAA